MIVLKILIIAPFFYPEIGSASNRLKNIYLALKEKGYEPTIVTTEPNYPNRNLYKDDSFWNEDIIGKEVVRIELTVRKYTSNIFKRLLYYSEMMFKFVFFTFKIKKDYEAVFVSSPPIFIGLAGVLAKRRLKTTLILDIRDLWPETLIGIQKLHNRIFLKMAYALERFLYRKADKIIVNSEPFADYMVDKKIPKAKITFIPNSLTDSELNLACLPPHHNKSQQAEIKVLYAGNVGLAQDMDTLIKIAAKLKHQQIKFEVIGYGFLINDMREKIADLGLDNIDIFPARNREETFEIIAKADMVYVTLKDSDVFKTVLPGKVVDYMGLGKAIVANVSGYCGDIIKAAECGYISEDGNLDELCGYILTLAGSISLRNKLGKNGNNYARQNFSWSVNLKALFDILEK